MMYAQLAAFTHRPNEQRSISEIAASANPRYNDQDTHLDPETADLITSWLLGKRATVSTFARQATHRARGLPGLRHRAPRWPVWHGDLQGEGVRFC
jgi:hypothetical protein